MTSSQSSNQPHQKNQELFSFFYLKIMYRLDLNNYYLNKKDSTIYTPKEVSQFLFNLLSPLLPNHNSLIIDPCCGGYSLLAP
jgi:type I restriction-modification system DNA methylase subunit